MAARLSIPLVFALAIMTIDAGCGGDSDSAPGTSSVPNAPDRSEFIRQASAACKEIRTDMADEMSTFLERREIEGRPSPTQFSDATHSILLPTVEAEIWRIEQLGTPPGDEERIDAMLDAERYAINEIVGRERIASRKVVQRYFTEADKRFRAYGLSACANGPQAG